MLFAAGRAEAFDVLREEPAVAVVGTRQASPYGTEVAYAIGRGLGASGVPVVSGLALGIDGTAHRGCLDGGGVPIAVVACGPDVVYPRRHRGLHQRVCEEGLVLSELPPGTEPFRWSFPARNRIMAGLARLTLVVEAADPSGSLITADFAKDLGRCVAAVPGRVTSRVAAGHEQPAEGRSRCRSPAPTTCSTSSSASGVRQAPVARTPRRLPTTRRSAPCSKPRTRAHPWRRSPARPAATAAQTRAALGRLEADGYLVRRDLGGWERAAW